MPKTTQTIDQIRGLPEKLAALATPDTGWRDITSLLSNGWASSRVLIRRQGNWTVLRITGLNPATATGSYFLTGLPAGWLIGNENIAITASSTMPAWVMGNGSSVSLPTTTPAFTIQATATQYVDLPFPTSMPGTAV